MCFYYCSNKTNDLQRTTKNGIILSDQVIGMQLCLLNGKEALKGVQIDVHSIIKKKKKRC